MFWGRLYVTQTEGLTRTPIIRYCLHGTHSKDHGQTSGL